MRFRCYVLLRGFLQGRLHRREELPDMGGGAYNSALYRLVRQVLMLGHPRARAPTVPGLWAWFQANGAAYGTNGPLAAPPDPISSVSEVRGC